MTAVIPSGTSAGRGAPSGMLPPGGGSSKRDAPLPSGSGPSAGPLLPEHPFGVGHAQRSWGFPPKWSASTSDADLGQFCILQRGAPLWEEAPSMSHRLDLSRE